MRSRPFSLVGRLLALAMMTSTAAVLLMGRPSSGDQLPGGQSQFNLAVSRAVPRGATLARLEAVAGRGQRIATPAWLQRMILEEPGRNPDGFRPGDTSVSYSFPNKSVWYFQVRDGRLVNYDPSVLAGQPQERVASSLMR